jgi:hypothetical protein
VFLARFLCYFAAIFPQMFCIFGGLKNQPFWRGGVKENLRRASAMG